MNNKVKCILCDGAGIIIAAFHAFSFECIMCKGSGKISQALVKRNKIGQVFRMKRIQAQITCRGLAEQSGVKPSEISNMELGIIKLNKSFYKNLPVHRKPISPKEKLQ